MSDAMPLAAQGCLVDRRLELERVIDELRALRVRHRVGDGARARMPLPKIVLHLI